MNQEPCGNRNVQSSNPALKARASRSGAQEAPRSRAPYGGTHTLQAEGPSRHQLPQPPAAAAAPAGMVVPGIQHRCLSRHAKRPLDRIQAVGQILGYAEVHGDAKSGSGSIYS